MFVFSRLAIALTYYGYHVISLHSGRMQAQRYDAAQKFASGFYSVLVATDCAARGLNFPNVAHVVNYDMPRVGQFVQYIHRIGRTGRVGNEGRATTFFVRDNFQEDMQHVVNLAKTLRSANQPVPDWLQEMDEYQTRTHRTILRTLSNNKQPGSPEAGETNGTYADQDEQDETVGGRINWGPHVPDGYNSSDDDGVEG